MTPATKTQTPSGSLSISANRRARVLVLASLLFCGCDRDDSTKPSPAATSASTATQPIDVKDAADAERHLLGVAAAPTVPKNAPAQPTPPAGTADVASKSGLKYDIPASWKTQPTSGPMRLAQFALPAAPDAPDDANCVVMRLPKSDVEANIARWRGQFQTADEKPVADDAVLREKRTVNGLNVWTVRITGRFKDAMTGRTTQTPIDYTLFGAIVEAPDALWFFKATGPAATISAQQDSFAALVGSFRKE